MSAEHIVIFLPSLGGGGAERIMVNLAGGLARQGLRVDLVLARAEGPYLSQVSPDVRIVDLAAQRVLFSLPGLVRYLRQEKPTAMLSALDHANIVALWARWLSGVPTRVVVSVLSTISIASRKSDQVRSRLMPYLVRLFYPRADAIVAVSKGVADDLSRATGLPRERIKVIYNPVVTPELPEKAKEPLHHPWFAPGAPPVILGVGRLDRAKDFPTLIRAFALLRQKRKARLVILGEGEERPVLEALTRELGINEDVDMPGFVENPYAYMSRAAVFVLSSTWEGLPGVLIEAMAVGTPVVATDCPSGPSEILEAGRYGKLVLPENPHALAQAIEETLASTPEVQTVRNRAAKFSLERITGEYIQLFNALHIGGRDVA